MSCGDVIGVYEPLIKFVEGRAHETSRLEDPLVGMADCRCYHRTCYETLAGEPDDTA